MSYIRYDDQAAEYMDYILDRISLPVGYRTKYSKLLDYLFETPFVWSIANDVNREMDGLELREEYFDEEGIDYEDRNSELDEHKCSCLEMMVALSEKIEYHIMGEPGDDYPARWLIEMIENLGLDEYDDYIFDEKEVEKIVHNWLKRRYDEDGNGSIFPRKRQGKNREKKGKNLKRVEIWYQMAEYLDRNYPIF